MTPVKKSLLVYLLCAAFGTAAYSQVKKNNLGPVFGYTPGTFGVTDAGTASYSINLVLSPGTSEMMPHLSLFYDSQGNNGMIGSGWNMQGLSAISRSSQTYAQDQTLKGISLSASDRFSLDGERLVSNDQLAYGSDDSQYITEQNNFSRIVCHTAQFGQAVAPAYFIVNTKSGLTMEYGNSADSRIRINGSVPVYWLLNKVTDKAGNYFTISYNYDPATGEYTPKQIDYTGNNAAHLVPYCKVVFQYESRPDIVTRYFHGLSMVSCSKRLSSVTCNYQDTLVRRYILTYESSAGPAKLSRLKTIQEFGSDGTSYPPTQFTYKDRTDLTYKKLELTNIPCISTDSIMSFDANSDGVMDILKMPQTGAIAIYKGNKDAAGLTYAPMPVVPAMSRDGKTKATFGDFNGDGREDFILYTATNAVMYLNKTRSTDSKATFVAINNVIPVSANTILSAADLNGDGRTDILAIDANSGENKTYLSTTIGFNGFTYNNNHSVSDILPAGYINNADYTPLFQDFDGDGLIDVLFANKKTGETHLFINQGGFVTAFAEKATNLSPAAFSGGTEPHNCELYPVDINGDGVADLVFRDGNKQQLTFWINKGDYTFVLQKTMTPNDLNILGQGLESAYFYFNDFNADGYLDMLYFDTKNAGQVSPMKIYLNDGNLNYTIQSPAFDGFGQSFQILGYGNFSMHSNLDFCIATNKPGPPPPKPAPPSVYTVKLYQGSFDYNGLLTQVQQGNGQEYTVHYDYLSNDALYQKGENSVYPVMDYQASHFVVSEFKTDDGVGGRKTVSYTYGQARVQINGRGFRGFGFVKSRDGNTGTEQIKHFITDADSWKYTNSPLISITTLLYNGSLISQTRIKSSLIAYNGGNSYYAYAVSSTTQNYELSGALVNTITTRQSVDNSGNIVTNVTDYGGYVDSLKNTYNDDPVAWSLGRLATSKLYRTDPSGNVLVKGSAFTYYPNGLLRDEISEPDASDQFKTVKHYDYDGLGNILKSSLSGWDGRATVTQTVSTTYDPFGRFILTTTNPLGQSLSMVYDPLLGHVLTQTTLNHLTTSYTYDGFGRLVTALFPDGNWNVTYYLKSLNNEPLPANGSYLLYKESSDGPPVAEYHDLLDRKIRQTRVGFDGRRAILDTRFNNDGYVIAESLPYFEGDAPQFNTYDYDLLGRRIRITDSRNSVSKINYDGNTTTYINPLNQQKTITRDSKQQVISSVDVNGSTLNYAYNADGSLLSVKDPEGNILSFQYDIRGLKIGMSDPDLGKYQYVNNSFGEVVEQVDDKNRKVEMSYDLTGRPLTRTDADGLTAWTYDAGNNIGLPATISSYNGYSKTFVYDQLGRKTAEIQVIRGKTYRQSYSYDQLGRLAKMRYPSGFAVNRAYNSYGYLSQVSNASNGRIYWTAQAVNANGQIEKQLYGNGVELEKDFDPHNLLLSGIVATKKSAILQKMSFVYDVVGNLTLRSDLTIDREEDFTYDNLNRLTSAQVKGDNAVTVSYDMKGNITHKSDVGDYHYGAVNNHPHQLQSITGAPFARQYGFQMDVQYNSFNKAASIKNGREKADIFYNADQQRVCQQLFRGKKLISTKIYINGYMEQEVKGCDTITSNFITSPEGVFAVYTTRKLCPFHKLQYLYRDQLGSVVMVTNRHGHVIARYSFDAWGMRRKLDWSAADPKCPALFKDRGYTGQEHYDLFEMVDMNGRIYDPGVGRFLTADPSPPDMSDLQSFNRFTYVDNNPLKFVDPTGYFGFGDIIGAIGSAFGAVGNAIAGGVSAFAGFVSHVATVSANWVGQNWQTLAVVAVSIAVGAVTGGAGLTLLGAIGSGAAAGFASSTVSTLLAGGNIGAALSAGLKGAVIGGITAGATFEVGELLNHVTTTDNIFGKVASHGVIQGLASVASGDKFIHGFYAGAITPVGSFATDYLPSNLEKVAIASIIGGTTSELAGGKFANGAVSAAFVEMYNETAGPLTTKEIEKVHDVLDFHSETFDVLGYISEYADNEDIGIYSGQLSTATRNIGYTLTGVTLLVDVSTGNGYETTWEVVSNAAKYGLGEVITNATGRFLGGAFIDLFHATPTASPELDQVYYQKSPSGAVVP